MAFNELVEKAKTYFPELQIKYKDQDTLMQVLGKIMFFNPKFMTSYVTTLGDTVYFPSEQFVQDNPVAVSGVFIHECTHMYDEKRVSKPLFSLGYLFPQILSLLVWLLVFFVSWKILLLLSVVFLLPWPAPFRAHFEKRAYFVQMYVDNKLYGTDTMESGTTYASWFRNGNYYWMWIFGFDKDFAQEAINITSGKSEVDTETALGVMVNDLITVAR